MAKSVKDYQNDYQKARAKGDVAGMMAANKAANSLRKKRGEKQQSSKTGDVQFAAGLSQKMKMSNYSGIAQPQSTTTASPQSIVRKTPGTPYQVLAKGRTGRNDREKIKNRETVRVGTNIALQEHAAPRAIMGASAGFLPVNDAQRVLTNRYGENTANFVTNSNSYKGGKMAGQLVRDAALYTAGAGLVNKGLSGVPAYQNLGKAKKAAVRIGAVNTAVGAPYNAYYNYQAGERGKDLAISTAKDTAMYAAFDGALETVPYIYRGIKGATSMKGKIPSVGLNGKTKFVNDVSVPSSAYNVKSRAPIHQVRVDEKTGVKTILPERNKTSYIPPETVPDAMKPAYDEFINSTDEGLIKFAKRSKERAIPPKANYKISDVGQRERDDINRLLGIDISGYEHNARPNAFQHIEKRHGKSGIHDRSMADEADVGRIGYTVQNYDSVDLVRNEKGEIQLSSEFFNADGTKAPLIKFAKRVDGHMYAVEAVPDSKGKKLQLVSSYIEKLKKGDPQPLNMQQGLQFTPETPFAQSSFNQILPQEHFRVNNIKDVNGKPQLEKPKLQTYAENMKNSTVEWADDLYEKLVDNQHHIGKAVKGVKQTADKDAKILASNYRNARGQAQHIIEKGMVDREGRKISDVSIKEMIESAIHTDWDQFQTYMLNKHNIARFKNGKPVFGEEVTADISRGIVADIEKQYPQFKALSEQWNQMNSQLIDNWLVEGGLITPEMGDILKKLYPDYVPVNRVGVAKIDGVNTKSLKANAVIKTATGGNKPIVGLNQSIPALIQKAIMATRKNEVYQGLLDAVRRDPERMKSSVQIIQDTAQGKYGQQTIFGQIDDALRGNGLEDITNIMDKLDGIDEMGNCFVTAMERGKPVRMTVSEELYNSLKNMDYNAQGTLDNMAKFVRDKATNPFKALITGYNPFFALRNIARDIPTAYIQGTQNNPFKFAGNLGEAARLMKNNDPIFQEYLALGGKASGYFNNEKGIRLEGLGKKGLRKAGEVVSKFNEDTETIPRFAEYLATLKREGTSYAAKQRAIYNAGEVTVNFARHGNTTKAIDQLVPYLNPAVQGLDKFARSLSKKATWAKGVTAVTVPTMALRYWNEKVDKENYDKLDSRTKDNNFLFPAGDGKYVKIPKSREAGVLFGSLIERLMNASDGKSEPFKGFGNTVATNFSPNNPIENNIFTPATLNLATNKDFAGRSIVPESMLRDKRPAYLQYDETTSEIGKWLGENAKQLGINKGNGLSPKQIDYILDSYLGIIADIGLEATKQGGNVIGRVLTRPFTADAVYNNSIQNDFYENLDNATAEKTIKNLAENIPSEWVTPEEKRVSVYNKAAAQMSELRKQEKALQSMPNGKLKQERQRQLRMQINEIAAQTKELADAEYETYKKNYIPEISGMSDKMQENYKETLQPKGVTPKQFAEVYDTQRKYKHTIQKAMALQGTDVDTLKVLGISDQMSKKAALLQISGISIEEIGKAKEAIKDVEGNKHPSGKVIPTTKDYKQKQIIDQLYPNYTRAQKLALYNALGISNKVW